MAQIYNPNPIVFASTKKQSHRQFRPTDHLWLDDDGDQIDVTARRVAIAPQFNDFPLPTSSSSTEAEEPIDSDEIFDLIRSISDPEHPNSLEELHVVSAPQIDISSRNLVRVEFTPTVPHCGMSTLIGLSIRVRLMRSLPDRFKVDINVKPGSHQSEHAVNKQLNDKERVAAALENPALVETVERCLANAGLRGQA